MILFSTLPFSLRIISQIGAGQITRDCQRWPLRLPHSDVCRATVNTCERHATMQATAPLSC